MKLVRKVSSPGIYSDCHYMHRVRAETVRGSGVDWTLKALYYVCSVAKLHSATDHEQHLGQAQDAFPRLYSLVFAIDNRLCTHYINNKNINN